MADAERSLPKSPQHDDRGKFRKGNTAGRKTGMRARPDSRIELRRKDRRVSTDQRLR